MLPPLHDPALLAAGLLSAAICALHTFAGGATVARPLLRAEFDPVAKYTQYYCWHLVTATLAIMALAFTVSAFRPEARDLAGVMTLLATAFAVWGLVLPPIVRQGYLRMPQGWLFVPVTIAGLIGVAT